jgi:hypothetical protein
MGMVTAITLFWSNKPNPAMRVMVPIPHWQNGTVFSISSSTEDFESGKIIKIQ